MLIVLFKILLKIQGVVKVPVLRINNNFFIKELKFKKTALDNRIVYILIK